MSAPPQRPQQQPQMQHHHHHHHPPPGAQQPRQNQVQCRGCRTTLAYPANAPSVRCPICETVTDVQQIRIECLRCVTPLLLPANTTLALCPRCGLVMRIPPNVRQVAFPQQNQQPAPPPQEQKAMVYVENPPSKVNGKAVANVSVGTKVSNT